MKLLLCTMLFASLVSAAEGYKVTGKIKIGGTGGWDYLAVDPAAQRLYASHGSQVEVVDLAARKVIGQVTQLRGVHGIALAPQSNKGFITNGQAKSVTVIDLKSLSKLAEVPAGDNPDAICYEPKTQRVVAFNGLSGNITVISATTNEVVATIPVGPKPENCAVDGAGKMYANIENSSEVVEIDVAAPAVTRRAPLAPCDHPSGIAIDEKNRKLFSVCENKIMAVTDIATLKVIATPAIGAGPDGAGFDPGTGVAFSSNGGDGTMTLVKVVNGKYEAIDTIPTARGARTMTVDPVNHRAYSLAAEYGPAPEGADGKKGRPQPVPDSFSVLVIAK